MAHTLTLQIEVDENDGDIEREICWKLQDIFTTACSLIDFAANHVETASVVKNNG
jgi:hypothetical protein